VELTRVHRGGGERSPIIMLRHDRVAYHLSSSGSMARPMAHPP